MVAEKNYSNEIKGLVRKEGYSILSFTNLQINFRPNQSQKNCNHHQIGVFTSGTTGTPKLIKHSWKSLFTAKNIKDTPKRWLLTYSPGSYAWFQMVTLFFFISKQDLVFAQTNLPEDLWQSAANNLVEAISSTPTFWRYLILKIGSARLKELDLQQITLGGEVIDQRILDQLSFLFPNATITHIYAATEVGAAIVVSDGKAGFPKDMISEKNIISMKIIENILYIQSPYASGDQEWICTNDLVEESGNRVYIVGRNNQKMINIGGNKMSIQKINSIIINHPEVLWCKVYTKKNPITGAIVVADVVINNTEFSKKEEVLTKYCQENSLPEWAIPRKWYFKQDIELGANFKSKIEND